MSSDDDTIRVLLVDDDPIVRAALESYLAPAPDMLVVGSLSDGRQAVEADLSEVDVVVMDVRMPELNGLEAARQLREGTDSRPRVLLLTSFDEEALAREAIVAQASGLLLKTATPKAILEAVRAVHHGATVFSDEPLTRLISADRRAVSEPPPHLRLNRREQEILELLAQAYSNAEIAEQLFLSESTVKTYVSSLMAQLGVDSRLKAVVRAFEWNLVER
ncbi:response regulator [Micropruina sp.]|uniref:response regulator n=1 Tax=Micropruina sp. TaxID=2737536 RepID=UPI0039E37449